MITKTAFHASSRTNSPKFITPISGGKTSTGLFEEEQDCTVRALANSGDMEYIDAHQVLKEHGRKNRTGTYFHTYHTAYLSCGFELCASYGTTQSARYTQYKTGIKQSKGIVLSKLLETIPEGSYIVLVTGHALSVIDGEVVDTVYTSTNKRVVALYKKIDY